MDKNNFVKNEIGICPVCGKPELNYINDEFFDDFMVYEWECMNCEAIGKEVFELIFISHEQVEEYVEKNMEEEENE